MGLIIGILAGIYIKEWLMIQGKRKEIEEEMEKYSLYINYKNCTILALEHCQYYVAENTGNKMLDENKIEGYQIFDEVTNKEIKSKSNKNTFKGGFK